MIEQYVYSRSDKSFVNSVGQKIGLGHGFMAWTDGVTADMQKALLLYCASFNNKVTTLADGGKAPVLIKAALSNGETVLQCSTWMQENRGFHVAHGYVLPAESAEQVCPEHWFLLPYQTTDANAHTEAGGLVFPQTESLPGKPLTLVPLAQAMEAMNIGREQFKQLLRACLDAIPLRRQVQIACDFTQPEFRAAQQQVLCWIYRCLPWALRRALGFDMTFTAATAPRQYQIAFVADRLVQVSGRSVTVRAEKPVPLGSHYLFMGGEVYHGRGAESRFDTDTLFGRWMDRLVDVLWDAGEQFAPVLEQLEAVYACLQESIGKLALNAEEAIAPELYDALFWNNMIRADQPHLESVLDGLECSEEEAYAAKETLLRLPVQAEGGEALAVSALEDVWGRSQREDDPRAMTLLRLVSDRGGKIRETADAMAGALFARALRRSEDVPAQMEVYREKMEPACYARALQVALFTGPQSGTDAACWNELGLDAGEAALYAVRNAWAFCRLKKAMDMVHLLELVINGAAALPGIDAQQAQIVTAQLQENARICIEQAEPAALGQLGRVARYCLDTDPRTVDIARRVLVWLKASHAAGAQGVGLTQLEELQKAFQPSAADPVVAQVWRELFCETFARSKETAPDTLYPVCPEIFDRLRKLLQAVVWESAEQRAGYASEMFGRAMTLCTVASPEFMTAEWMQEQLAILSACEQRDKLMTIWQVLALFMQKLPELQPEKKGMFSGGAYEEEFFAQWNCLKGLQMEYALAGGDIVTLYQVLANLYVKDVLPQAAGVIALYAGRYAAAKVGEKYRIPTAALLNKLLVQGEPGRLEGVLTLCRNVEQADVPTDVWMFRGELLQALCAEDVLDALHKGISVEEAAAVTIMRNVTEMTQEGLLDAAQAQMINSAALGYLREKGGMLHKPLLGMYEKKYLRSLTDAPEERTAGKTAWKPWEKLAGKSAKDTGTVDGWGQMDGGLAGWPAEEPAKPTGKSIFRKK